MKALINYEIADAFYNATGLDVIPLKPYSKLDLPVSAHADMLFCLLDIYYLVSVVICIIYNFYSGMLYITKQGFPHNQNV